MAITISLDDPIGEIRLLIGDGVENDGVKPQGANFSDEELAYFYEEAQQDLNLAAALACETLAWLWNVYPDFSADGLNLKRSQIALNWWRAAVNFRAKRGARIQILKRTDGYSGEVA